MAYNFSKLKILVVEENQPMTQIICALLKGFGIAHIDVATTSEIALRKFQQEKHDLLLIDWLIKPDNGIDLTQIIRLDKDSPNPFVPIILMTGFTEKRRVLKARDTGITEFLVKPFNANDLYKRIEHIIEKPRQFVKAPGFFGPDRRRKVITGEKIPKRRSVDKKKNN
jgi:two-component system, chemotaxis family, chemotaxis protein CheY